MSDAVLLTISLGITVLGYLGAWAAYRSRGLASGMRGAAWSTVPMAAYLTGLTEFFADLVFSPVKWAGVALAALAVVLYMTSGVMLRRGAEDDGPAQVRDRAGKGGKGGKGGRKDRKKRGADSQGAIEPSRGTPPAAGADPDMADIEAILRRRGIQ